jgi:hypothetical protein
MRVGLTFICPDSLEQAQELYAQDMKLRGYEIVGEIDSYWQGDLFRDTMDAFVIAPVRRKKNAVT